MHSSTFIVAGESILVYFYSTGARLSLVRTVLRWVDGVEVHKLFIDGTVIVLKRIAVPVPEHTHTQRSINVPSHLNITKMRRNKNPIKSKNSERLRA